MTHCKKRTHHTHQDWAEVNTQTTFNPFRVLEELQYWPYTVALKDFKMETEGQKKKLNQTITLAVAPLEVIHTPYFSLTSVMLLSANDRTSAHNSAPSRLCEQSGRGKKAELRYRTCRSRYVQSNSAFLNRSILCSTAMLGAYQNNPKYTSAVWIKEQKYSSRQMEQ